MTTSVDEIAKGKVLKLRELNAGTLERILELQRIENSLRLRIENLEEQAVTLEQQIEKSRLYMIGLRVFYVELTDEMIEGVKRSLSSEKEKTALEIKRFAEKNDEVMADLKQVRDHYLQWSELLVRSDKIWNSLKLETQKNSILLATRIDMLAAKLLSSDEEFSAYLHICEISTDAMRKIIDLKDVKNVNTLQKFGNFLISLRDPALMNYFRVFDPDGKLIIHKDPEEAME